jgi:hypothetical protein
VFRDDSATNGYSVRVDPQTVRRESIVFVFLLSGRSGAMVELLAKSIFEIRRSGSRKRFIESRKMWFLALSPATDETSRYHYLSGQ